MCSLISKLILLFPSQSRNGTEIELFQTFPFFNSPFNTILYPKNLTRTPLKKFGLEYREWARQLLLIHSQVRRDCVWERTPLFRKMKLIASRTSGVTVNDIWKPFERVQCKFVKFIYETGLADLARWRSLINQSILFRCCIDSWREGCITTKDKRHFCFCCFSVVVALLHFFTYFPLKISEITLACDYFIQCKTCI